jgi:hypothetical protein
MAVTATGLRQTNPLIDELLKRAMQQGSSSVNQYTAESFGGNFPIGSLTADVLKGVRRRTAENQAQMAIDDKNRAMADLLAVRDDDRYTVDASGNITERTMMPREEVTGFDPSKLGQTERMDGTGAVIDSSVAQAMGTSTEDEAQNLAIALKAAQARETTGTPPSQLEQELLQEQVTPVTFKYGPEDDPNWFERNVLGKKLKGEEISNINPLAIKAGISPFDLQKLDLEQLREDEKFKLEKQKAEQESKKTELQTTKLTFEILNKQMDTKLKSLELDKQSKEYVNAELIKDAQTNLEKAGRKLGYTGYKLMRYVGGELLQQGFIEQGNTLLGQSTVSPDKIVDLTKDANKVERDRFKALGKAIANMDQLAYAARSTSGSDSYAIMIKFLKGLDGSVVKEGEVRAYNDFQGFLKGMEQKYSRFSGKGFTPKLKMDMYNNIKDYVTGLLSDYNETKLDMIKNNYSNPDAFAGQTLNIDAVYGGSTIGNDKLEKLGIPIKLLGNDVTDIKTLSNDYIFRKSGMDIIEQLKKDEELELKKDKGNWWKKS